MRLKMRYLAVVVTVFSGVLTVTGLSSPPKQKSAASGAATAVPSYIAVSASADPKGDPAQEKDHCFKAAPADALLFTVTSTDIKNHPLPENGMVTVEIISLELLKNARKNGLLKPDVSPFMKFEQNVAPIRNGQATINFKADASLGHVDTGIHLGPRDPMSSAKAGHYSNVALITISPAAKDANAADPVMYVYPYEIWQTPVKCAK